MRCCRETKFISSEADFSKYIVHKERLDKDYKRLISIHPFIQIVFCLRTIGSLTEAFVNNIWTDFPESKHAI